MNIGKTEKLRTFDVTIDVVGRYLVRIRATDADHVVDMACNAWDRFDLDVIECDDEVEIVDVREVA